MIHDGTVGYGASHHANIKKWQEYYDKIDQKCYEIYLDKIREKHPKYRTQDLKRRMRDDMIFYGQEAIDFGLADRLVKRGE
jgi:ATP-dependent protease ClpP protease subunit